MAKKLIHFAGYKFLPNLNPTEMFLLGIHGGSFFQHCDPNFEKAYPRENRGKQSAKYDAEINYYHVYPAKLLKTSAIVINHKEIYNYTVSFMEWYYGFYNGQRTPWDNDWINIHTSLVKMAWDNLKEYLSKGSLKDAQRYGQLLIELAMNPGYEQQ